MTYNTEKRTQICEIMKKVPGRAFTIEEISQALRPDGSGKSTVYRIISKMVDEGLVRKITDERSRHTSYQYLSGKHCQEHLHLKCKECGRLIHLDSETSQLVESKILLSRGFAIDEGALLFGKCESCALTNGVL